MAIVMNQPPTGTLLSKPRLLDICKVTNDPDEELFNAMPDTLIAGTAALWKAIQANFQLRAISATVKELPGRKSHLLRPQMQAIARLLFPGCTDVKAFIHYEESRRKACQIVRANEKVEKAMKEALKGGFKAQELQGPWAGQKTDPVSLAGPPALPMPVQIGEEQHFKDCFNFLSLDKDPADFCMESDVLKDDQYNLQSGKELIWNTPMVEFERGVAYVDGRLDLCKMVVGPTHIEPLIKALRSNNFVKHFLLGNNLTSATGCAAITAFIKDKPDQMETWYLAGNHIKAQGFKEMVDAMVMNHNPVITNVWLKRNPLGPASVPAIVKLITQVATLRTLDLENTELGDEGVAQIFNGLKGRAVGLKNVFLNANGVGEKGAAAVADALVAGWQPESLMLASNPIGDAGAKHLARALRSNFSLVRVGLQSNGYTSHGASLIADALSQHPTLRTVVFSPPMTTMVHGQRYNHIADEALPALKKLINNPELRVLELGRTAFSAEAVEDIHDAVASSNLCEFQAFHVNNGQSCSLRVRQQLESNVEKFYATDLDTFRNGLGLRLLRNTPDVRLIDSVYRTRDKREGSRNVKQYWDEGDPVWAMVDWEWQDDKRAEHSV